MDDGSYIIMKINGWTDRMAMTDKAIQERNANVINILKEIINSDSKWSPRAIELIGDYYTHKGENLKADEYFKLLKRKCTSYVG